MPKRVSGKRYAQAIFELAVEQDQLDQWAEDLRAVDQVLQDTKFRSFLKHAEVPTSAKTKALDRVLRDVHPVVRNLAALLVTRGAVDLVHDVQTGYIYLLDEHRGRQQVDLTSAVPLDDRDLDRITQFVSSLVGKEVVISTQVDESILGGIIIQIGDQLLDGSTRSRLEGLRTQIRSEVAVPSV